jgi:lysophospholipase L1-like esterase
VGHLAHRIYRLRQYWRRILSAMRTLERTLRAWFSRTGPMAAGVFAALATVAVVVTLTAFDQAAPGGSSGRGMAAKATSSASATVTPTSASRGVNRPITVVGIGDSVTAGATCSCKTFVELYATGLASERGLRTSSVNLGVGGWTSSQLLRSLTTPGAFRDQVAKSDILLVTIGANDLVPLESGQASDCTTTCYSTLVQSVGHNVELVVAAARAAQPEHPPTILVTNYWNVFQDGDVGTAENGGSFQSWSDTLTRAANAQICEGARRAGATCVDLYNPFKGDGSKNPTSNLAADGDHPNSAGHQLIASALLANTPLRIS